MAMNTIRRLASELLNVGESRVRISSDGIKDAKGVLTRADVKDLIDKGVITKAKIKGRASTRKKTRRGRGRRKGSLGDSKKLWMQKVRAQRKLLAMLIESGALEKNQKRQLYGKVKSGIFRSKKAMLLYLKDNGLLPQDYEPPLPKREKKPVKKKPEEKAEKKEGESA